MVAEIKKIQGLSRRGSIVSGAVPVLLIASCGVVAGQPELRLAVPLLIGATALMALLLAFTLYWGERTKLLWSPAVILAVACIMRLICLFTPPQLSDDLYRYLWDGSNLIRGVNPYIAAPSGIIPTPGLAVIHGRINHPDYVTIYPPAAQLLFAGGAVLGGATGLKALLLLVDMGLAALLLLLLERLEMPSWRAVLYAWNPLPLLEIGGSGHVDGAGMAMLMASFFLLLPGRDVAATIPRKWQFLLSGALAASAGLVKLYPFVLFPVLFLLVPKGRRRHFISGFGAALVILLLPFLPHLVNMAASLDAYARNWEFAGFAFTTLRTLTGSASAARLILLSFFLLVVAGIIYRLSASLKSAQAPPATARLALTACYAVAMAFLLLTPTLQPWYALCLAVFLPFCPGPAGLVLCWAVFLTYQVQIPYFILGEWRENVPVTAAVFLAPLTAVVIARFFAKGDTPAG